MARDPWGEFVRQATALRTAAEQAAGLAADAAMEFPDPQHGDLAFPCFAHAKAARKAPAAVAAELAAHMVPTGLVAAVRPTGPYVNFTADARALAGELLTAWRELGTDYGRGAPRAERVLVEHTSANPNGPLHVGRTRNPIIGDSLARLLRLAGHPVTTEFFVNDIGRQMVILAWGVKNLPAPPDAPAKEDHALVVHYREASKRFEEDPAVKERVSAMIYAFENGDEALTREVRAVAERGLRGMTQTLREIGVTFDSFFWESDLVLAGKQKAVVERLRAQCREENGALFVDMAAHGIQGREPRVFLTRGDGTSLYPTRDLAYHLDKFSRCDIAVNVLGEDHKLEHEELRILLRLMGVERSPEVLYYAFVSLPEGKMSTRRGVVVNMDDLIEEALERARAEVDRRRPELPEDRRREIARTVGISALRYNIVRVQPEKKITFHWEEALSFEGNAAPFLQYAHARCHGILVKAGAPEPAASVPALHAAETTLVKTLARYPSTVASAAEARLPHRIATYANALASDFNAFYRDCPVLEAPGTSRAFRLALVAVTKAALGSALPVLGVAAPDEM